MSLNVHDKSAVGSYVLTAEYDAGEYLGLQANKKALEAANKYGRINADYRPHASFTSSSYTICVCSNPAPRPVVYGYGRVQTREDDEKDNAKLACVIGTIITLVGGFLFGFAYKAYANQSEKLAQSSKTLDSIDQQIKQMQQSVPGGYGYNGLPHDHVIFKVRELVKQQVEIDELNYSRVRNYTIAALAALAGGVALLVGGLTMMPYVIAAGAVVAVAAGAFALFNLAYHWSDEDEVSKHYKTIVGDRKAVGLADQILSQLPYYDDRMQKIQFQAAPMQASQYQAAPMQGSQYQAAPMQFDPRNNPFAPLYPDLTASAPPLYA